MEEWLAATVEDDGGKEMHAHLAGEGTAVCGYRKELKSTGEPWSAIAPGDRCWPCSALLGDKHVLEGSTP